MINSLPFLSLILKELNLIIADKADITAITIA
jgi:hypothetical protein